jgi:hypothetical protein
MDGLACMVAVALLIIVRYVKKKKGTLIRFMSTVMAVIHLVMAPSEVHRKLVIIILTKLL